MLIIKEVKDAEHFERLRAKEDNTKDILYIRKYVPDMVLSDNNESLIYFFTSNGSSYEEIDIDQLVSETISSLDSNDETTNIQTYVNDTVNIITTGNEISISETTRNLVQETVTDIENETIYETTNDVPQWVNDTINTISQ